MVINGLNSGASTYMADFEDSTSPTWSNLTEGQRNLRDAVNKTISFTNDKTGKVSERALMKTLIRATTKPTHSIRFRTFFARRRFTRSRKLELPSYSFVLEGSI